MGKVPVHNAGKALMYVNGTMIPGGETRHFEEYEVPPHLRPKKAEPAPQPPADPLAELVAKEAADIAGALPGLADADLLKLGDMEQTRGNDAREAVIRAIGEEKLLRADLDSFLKQNEEKSIRKELRVIPEKVLPRIRNAEADGQKREGVIKAIEEEIARRDRK